MPLDHPAPPASMDEATAARLAEIVARIVEIAADRDRYRAAIEQLETRPTDFTLDAEGNMEAVREYARLILAPPTPAAQESKGEQA